MHYPVIGGLYTLQPLGCNETLTKYEEMVLFSAVHCVIVRCNTMHNSAVRCLAVHTSKVRCFEVQINAVKCSEVQYSAAQRTSE